MKNKFLPGAIATGFLTLGSATFSENANAYDLTGCTYPASYNLTVSNCQYVTDPISGSANDEADLFNVASTGNKINVNNVNDALNLGGDIPAETVLPAEGFFNITDWTFIVRDETDKLPSGTTIVTRTLDWSKYSSIMATFKDGRNSSILSYLLKPTASSFTWATSFNPWTATGITELNRAGDISHVTLYGVEAEVVPTPAAVLPGLVGMGLAALRKKKQEGEVGQDA
jgi:hypothetical protein